MFIERLQSLKRSIFVFRYAIIIILTVIFYLIYKYGPSFLDQELAGNLFIELFGFLVIYFFIDSSITRNKEEEDRKRKQICYNRLYRSLSPYVGFLKRLYKATRKFPPDSIPETLTDMLDNEFIENCEFLNWSSNPGIYYHQTWRDYFFYSNEKLIKNLNAFLDMYSYALDNKTINLIEGIISSNFMYTTGITNEANKELTRQVLHKGRIEGFISAGDGFSEVISLIIQLVDMTNPYINNPISVDRSIFNQDKYWGNARLQT